MTFVNIFTGTVIVIGIIFIFAVIWVDATRAANATLARNKLREARIKEGLCPNCGSTKQESPTLPNICLMCGSQLSS